MKRYMGVFTKDIWVFLKKDMGLFYARAFIIKYGVTPALWIRQKNFWFFREKSLLIVWRYAENSVSLQRSSRKRETDIKTH